MDLTLGIDIENKKRIQFKLKKATEKYGPRISTHSWYLLVQIPKAIVTCDCHEGKRYSCVCEKVGVNPKLQSQYVKYL